LLPLLFFFSRPHVYTKVISPSWDESFEAAAALFEPEQQVAHLNLSHGASHAAGKRWILKLNGRVSEPEEMVLTRDDELQVQELRVMFVTILQALLITKHIVFVGYQLQEEQFYRAMEAVGRVRKGSSTDPLCSLLVPTCNKALRRLYPDIKFVFLSDSFVPPSPDGFVPVELERALRRLNVFLDCTLAFSSVSNFTHRAFLLSTRFEAVLTESERALRAKVVAFLQYVHQEGSAMNSPSYHRVKAFLSRLGLREDGDWAGVRAAGARDARWRTHSVHPLEDANVTAWQTKWTGHAKRN